MFEAGAPKLNAAQALDHEGDYDEQHIGSMFKPTGAKVDVGKRRIRGDDDMPALYQGKSVSRDKLYASDSEEGEIEMSESGEMQMSEQGESMLSEQGESMMSDESAEEASSLGSDDDIDAALNAAKQEEGKATT